MSALDKAFIKACTRDSRSSVATASHRPANATPGPHLSANPTIPAAPPDGPGGPGRTVRVDDVPADHPSLRLAPHTAFPSSPSGSGPAEVSSHQGPDGPAAAIADAAKPPQQALSLQTIFSTAAADTDTGVDTEAAFSPDWEVDRLAWPAICERLMEAEDRYFRSVGQRLKAATEDSHHVVMITGARRGEGRTTLALCLARCAAAAGVRTALVDADLKNPQVGSRLGIETPCGWRAVAAGKTPLSEAAVSSLEDHLTLFPLTDAEPAEVAPGDPPCVSVLQRIAAHYPLVIVDTGPLPSDGQSLFATAGAPLIDTAIVVRDLRNTTEKKAFATAESLLRGGVPAVGIAENFCAAG